MNPKNILVRLPNWLGDIVMATPVIEALSHKFPSAKITVMLPKAFTALFEHCPFVDEIFHFSKANSFFERRKGQKNLIGKLRLGSYDLGLLLTNSFSSAWWFWQGHVKNRIGYEDHQRKWLLSQALKRDPAKHQALQYIDLLKPLDILDKTPKLHISLSSDWTSQMKERLVQRGINIEGQRIGIHASSSYGPAKCWPMEKFRELAYRLSNDNDTNVIFFGTPQEKPFVDKICKGLKPNVVNLAGQTTLSELMGAISFLDYFITNDSGPMHLAAAIGIPLTAIFGSTDPVKTAPLSDLATIVRKPVSCSPCHLRVCPIDFPCMQKISVDDVLYSMQTNKERCLNLC
jgi:heptosyltransferase II